MSINRKYISRMYKARIEFKIILEESKHIFFGTRQIVVPVIFLIFF